jgi:hypothetical protein
MKTMTLLSRLRRLFSQNSWEGEGFTSFQTQSGGRVVVDEVYTRYLESQAPQPTNESLQQIFANVARVSITQGGVVEGRPLSREIVFETDEESDLLTLQEALRIEDEPARHCMCHGNIGISLFDGVGRQLAVIGVHHGETIRWDRWKDDGRLVNGWELVDWLLARGIRHPVSVEQIREHSLDRIGRFLGSSLQAVGRAIYSTMDGPTVLTLGVSTCHPDDTFFFAFRSDQQAALKRAVPAYAAFACGSPYRILVIPFSELSSWLGMLQPVVVNGGSSYWAIRIIESGERLLLQDLHPQQELDLQRFLL